jgi:hypothetical protein
MKRMLQVDRRQYGQNTQIACGNDSFCNDPLGAHLLDVSRCETYCIKFDNGDGFEQHFFALRQIARKVLRPIIYKVTVLAPGQECPNDIAPK